MSIIFKFSVFLSWFFFVSQAAFAACMLGISEKPKGFNFVSAKKLPAEGSVLIHYVGHSSFLIVSPKGVSAVTDYNGVHSPGFVPEIVTMNNSHETHYTDFPEPQIVHVLRGWSRKIGAGPVQHRVKLRDMAVWNVPTNLGVYGDPKGNRNSIFVFQVGSFCIAHLGHLDHLLSRDQLLGVGRIDVLFVPIDGSSTLSHPNALAVIKQIGPKLVVPMHFRFLGAPESFMATVAPFWKISSLESSDIILSRRNLPRRTEVIFLKPGGPLK